jgi:ribosome-associated translation inhibitor RaiA
MDMYKSLGEAMDKIEAQAHKHHQKLSDKHHEAARQALVPAEAE